MTGKLKTAVLKLGYLNNQLYNLKLDMELGVIPDIAEVETLLHEFEKANNKRVSILKELGESNLSTTYMDGAEFKDGGEIFEGKICGPVMGALDFISEQSNSPDLFMQQMAEYVTVCL